MNNNYHTQIENPNILNEIAANNHLLLQQMPTKTATPIVNQPTQPTEVDPRIIQYYMNAQKNNMSPEIELSEIKQSSIKAEPKVVEKPVIPVEKTKPVTIEQPKTQVIEKITSNEIIKPKKSNKLMFSIIGSIVIIIVFLFLTHAKTNVYLNKYIPNIATNKGILIRAMIIGIIYFVASYFVNKN